MSGPPSLKVLVADANPLDRQSLVDLLHGAGHRVTTATNGRAVVEAVIREPFDAVFVALRMPLMDGIQAARHIRALPPPSSTTPIIGLSTDAPAAAAPQYSAAGLDHCLSKPLAAETLFQALREVTADNRPRRSAADDMPTLDASVIEELCRFLKPSQVATLLSESLVDIAARMRRLADRLDETDVGAAAKEAHDLVSVAGNCGARALSALAREIERACKQGAIADAIMTFPRMQATATAAERAITDLQAGLAEA